MHNNYKNYTRQVKDEGQVFFSELSDSQPQHLPAKVSSQKWSPYTNQGTTADGSTGVYRNDQWQTY